MPYYMEFSPAVGMHGGYEISCEPFDHFLSDAQKLGFLRRNADLSRLVEVP